MTNEQPSLDASHEKLRRAKEHFETLKGEIEAFYAEVAAAQPDEIVLEPDPDTGKTVFSLRPAVQAPVLRFGVVIGDVVHNLRSSLDYVIEQLTIRDSGNRLPMTEFPVFIDPTQFSKVSKNGQPLRGSGLYKIRGITDLEARARIEGVQPYSWTIGRPLTEHPLYVLHELWIMDKHRLPPVTALKTLDAQVSFYRYVLAETFTTSDLRSTLPYEDGAEIARLPLAPDQPPEAKVEAEGTVHVFFGESSPTPEGWEVIAAVHSFIGMTEDIIGNFDRFFV